MSDEKLRSDILAEADGGVNDKEPDVAAEAVEDAPQARVLVSHARQLAVGAVKAVGPDEEKHTCDVDPHIVKIEGDAGCDAEDDGGDGDGIWCYAESPREASPHISYGAIESEVNVLLGVHRL